MLAGGAEWRAAAAAAALAAAACVPLTASAQRGDAPPPRFEEAPMPPRIDDVTPNERALANNPPAADNPNRARLAALPEDRAEAVDEIVVTGEDPWRHLPDLGSAWRAKEEAELARRSYVFAIFPRDDNGTPAEPMLADPFLVNRDGLPSGEINIVRFRFGRRDRAAEPDAR